MISISKLDAPSTFEITKRALFPDFQFYIVKWRRHSVMIHWRGWYRALVPDKLDMAARRLTWRIDEMWQDIDGDRRLRKIKAIMTGNYYPWYVNIYCVDRCYGGPEEGGWWYDAGHPATDAFERTSFGVDTHEEAQRLQSALLAKTEMPDGHHNRYSVIGDADIEVYIEDTEAVPFPTHRPRYC